MTAAPSAEDAIGLIGPVGRSPGIAPAVLICDSGALAGLGAVLDETRQALIGRSSWRTAPVPTSPEGCALKLPDYVVHVFRRSATQLDLLSTPGEVSDEIWDATEKVEHQVIGSVSAPSGVLCLSPLDAVALDLAAAVPSLAGDSLAFGDMGLEGILVRVDAGDYAVSYARHMLDEYVDVELYRLQRSS